ncbi:CHASE2 domain-containing protein [Nitrincola alkalilacustris]|uniref:CHASE2 domain-containing protein n=1 Tax=Nitrincola alkalilacustris TaxID=1571224 RepID=UPI00124BF6CD|nr:adenylate/guanylate cyclase domain-containing protein [Nitrincola alkalilacustris]
MQRGWLHLWIALTLYVITLGLYTTLSGFVDPYEVRLKDQMLSIRGEMPADADIIIIDIDERSLSEHGQWPWSRDLVAELLLKLHQAGIGMIGLDIIFPEPDRSSPHRVLKALGLPADDAPDHDQILLDAIMNTPTVSGYVFAMEPDGIVSDEALDTLALIVEYDKPVDSLLPKPHRSILGVPQKINPSLFSGYINTLPDKDGVIRHMPLLMEFNGMLYPSLALEMTRLALGVSRVNVLYEDIQVAMVQLEGYQIPTDMYGRVRINFRGEARRYNYISASEVLNQSVSSEDLAGKIAFIGTSAAGLYDLRSTPLDSVFPGVEVHATVLDNLLNQDFLMTPYWAPGADVAKITAVAVLVWLFLTLPGSSFGSLLALVLLIFLLILDYYLMVSKGLVLHSLLPVLLLISLFLIGTVLNYVLEARQKAKIIRRFERKVSHDVVTQLLKSEELILEGSEQEVTVFFSDIRGFTALSEMIGSAKALILLLNRYMTPMTGIITAHKGTVDKFIGDAIMAYWNAPLPDQFHADQALQAAIEQIMALEQLNEMFQQEGLPPLKIGIGLNTGVAVVGEMGSTDRSDYTCIGDEVNLASRTEGLCKLFGATIVLTESTLQALRQKERYRLRCLGRVAVKGREHPVTVYESLGYVGQEWVAFDTDAQLFMEYGLSLFQQARFTEAAYFFTRLLEQDNQALYRFYLDHCLEYQRNPEPDFDGTLRLTSK